MMLGYTGRLLHQFAICVPVRNGAVGGVVVPRTAAFDAVRAGSGTRRTVTFFGGVYPFRLLFYTKSCKHKRNKIGDFSNFI